MATRPPKKRPQKSTSPKAADMIARGPRRTAASILNDYDSKYDIHTQLRGKCEQLLREILDAEKIRVHSVSGRVKERRKLEEKLRAPGKSYRALEQVTDIVGLRIITYFDDDVDAIASIIKREFKLDDRNCVDKRKSLEPDQFGYLSLHYVCGLSPERLSLPEYRAFENLAFELQIRSLLQHTWAEIEHDLGYKTGTEVPTLIRRRFSQVAGLLEIADREFREIRDTLSDYENKVTKQIIDKKGEITLDRISLAAFVRQSATVKQLDAHLARLFGGSRLAPAVDEDGHTMKFLAAADVHSVGELRSELESHRARLIHYEEITCADHCNLEEIESGLCLFHLAQILIALRKGVNGLASVFKQYGFGPPGEELESAQEVVQAMKASGYSRVKTAGKRAGAADSLAAQAGGPV
jgi:putative GTP pyrophosphokinase